LIKNADECNDKMPDHVVVGLLLEYYNLQQENLYEKMLAGYRRHHGHQVSENTIY